jgi:TolA-binding protein
MNHFKAFRHRGLLCGCIVVVGFVVCADSHREIWGQSTSPDRLAEYLNDLQLYDLLSAHLEQRLAAAADDQQREKIGVQLVSLYSGEIQKGSLDDDELAATLRRLEQVLLTCPQLRTAELNILLIQAEYQQAFLDLSRWMENRNDMEARNQAVSAFTALAPQFDRQIEELQEKVEKLQRQLDAEENEAQIDKVAAEQDRLKAALLRASYYAAWNDYYLAVGLVDASARGQAAARARQRFADFLSFDLDLDYEIADPESLELEMPLRARAGLGMAVMESMNDQTAQAQKWLEWLGTSRVDREIREDREGEFILALLLTDQYDEAMTRARNQIRDLGPPASLPTVRLCRTLARYGEFAAQSRVAQAESLRALGYEGLVRQRQFQLALEILDEFKTSAPSSNNFFLGWLEGYQLFTVAEQTQKTEDFEAAAKRLSEVAYLPGAKSNSLLYGYFIMQLAWAEYQSKQYEAAVSHFNEATAALKDVDRNVAIDSAWMKAVSLQQLAAVEPARSLEAIEAFQIIVLEFADHPKASEARYQIARLQRQAGTSANPIAALERVTSQDTHYLLARFEICLVRFDLWKQEKDPKKRTELAQQLWEDVDLFCRLGNPQEQSEKCLRCRMMATEAAFGEQNKDEADRQLNAARLLADQQVGSSPSVSQFHYWKLMQARRDMQTASTLSEARWLVEQAQQSAYRQAGLVYLTQQLEVRYADAADAQKQAISDELVNLYKDLVGLLGTDTKTLATNRNARVALYKLGWHQYELQQHRAAAETFGHLVDVFPDNQSYLRYLGLSEYHIQRYSESVQHWGKLLRGLESGSEPWFEARYYELDSLRRVNKDRAQKVWKQFQLLHPNIPFPAWQTRFEALESSLSS